MNPGERTERLLGRARQAWRVVQGDGLRVLVQRVLRRALRRLVDDAIELRLLPEDVADADRIQHPHAIAIVGDRSLEVGWICTPPVAGSGGHTTLLRFVEALEDRGHRCVLYMYDRFRGDAKGHAREIRSWWPHIRAEVRDVSDGLAPMDAYFATSWSTAHVLASRGDVPGRRFYLVQDFEPYFYGRGSEYTLAEETYRFGFECISVGHMVADVLREKFGLRCTVAEFGCDRAIYGLRDVGPRTDVVFYSKPNTERRGYSLGVLALELFHRRHPDVVIHTFGSKPVGITFPVVDEGNLRPAAIANLYNRCITGLALSFTNVSLVTHELLACGTIPVVNDSPYTRADLDNPHVAWARPTPQGLAAALCDVVEMPDHLQRATSVAASVAGLSWEPARRTVVDAVERVVYGRTRHRA